MGIYSAFSNPWSGNGVDLIWTLKTTWSRSVFPDRHQSCNLIL